MDFIRLSSAYLPVYVNYLLFDELFNNSLGVMTFLFYDNKYTINLRTILDYVMIEDCVLSFSNSNTLEISNSVGIEHISQYRIYFSRLVRLTLLFLKFYDRKV